MEEAVLLSPIRPRPTGLGLAMRADRILRALARLYRVHLRVVPVSELAPSRVGSVDAGPAATAAAVWRAPGLLHALRHAGSPEESRLAPGLGDALRASLRGVEPACIFVFRHVLVPLALEVRRPGTALVVDLDELESSASEQLARLLEARGEGRAAARMRRRGRRYRAREAAELARADQLWVASSDEALRVRGACGLGARVVPNVVDVAADAPASARAATGGPRRLLFVGGLGYLPNLDAVEWTAREVVPRVAARLPGPVELRVVGAGSRRATRSLKGAPGVVLAGAAPRLAPEYEGADVCVVPVRAGGGTRIKLLEALAHGRPVVSTTIGVEGLDLEPGRDLLVADDAAAFAEACGRLLADPAGAARLAARGLARVREAYGPRALEGAVAGAVEALQAGRAA